MDFMIKEQNFNEALHEHDDFKSKMSDILEKIHNINNKLLESEWKGQSRNEFSAYFDILVQYHEQVCGTSSVTNNPVEKMGEALKELSDRSESFCDESQYYKLLRDRL